jgi:hypothetical protein
VFGRLRNQPIWAKMPALRPIQAATTQNGAAISEWNGAGRTYTYVQMRFVRMPVTSPGIGPARTPTRTVPIESM